MNQPLIIPSASLPPPAMPRYDSLDVWRGLACLMIVVLHASMYAKYVSPAELRDAGPVATALLRGISRLGIGVPMFFVISGYCIAATADRSRRESRSKWEYFR